MPPLTIILLAGFILGLCTGFIMHRADYCMAGMFRDFFLFRTIFKLRTLLLLVITSMVLFEAARLSGMLQFYPFPLLAPPSMVNIAGGFIFGIGMVLAGGCVVGTLYKMGAGSMPSATAFAGIIIGSFLYAEIHPWWKSVSAKTALLGHQITLPQLLGINPLIMVLATAGAAGWYFVKIYRSGGWVRTTYTEGSLQPWKAAVLLAIIGTVSYVINGMPLGITTAYAKMGSYLAASLFPDHVRNLTYFQATPLDYHHPLTGMRLLGGAGPTTDAITFIQFPVIGGIVAGSACSALLLKEFRIYCAIPARQYLSALLGGIAMGLASRMAPACNVWHLFGGLPLMAMQSILFLAGLLPGAWIGARILERIVIR